MRKLNISCRTRRGRDQFVIDKQLKKLVGKFEYWLIISKNSFIECKVYLKPLFNKEIHGKLKENVLVRTVQRRSFLLEFYYSKLVLCLTYHFRLQVVC